MDNLTDIRAVRDLLGRHGFRFSKAMGQNFLINPSVCPRMAEACVTDPAMTVLEIGPGIGVLTRALAERARRVVAVELDERLPPVLAETLAGYDNVTIVPGDAMKLDLHALLREAGGGPAAVCANLPYYITSPLLMRLLEERLPVESITVMVQKEAAARLCAPPGSRACGAITLAVWYYAEPERLFAVSAGSFLPAPRVDSAVIRLRIRREPPCRVTDERRLFRIIRAAFGQRRKTLPNALAGGGFDREAVLPALSAAEISAAARAEELTLADFARLAEALAVPPEKAIAAGP